MNVNPQEWAHDVKTFRLTSDELKATKSLEELSAVLKERLAEGEYLAFETMLKEGEGQGEKDFLKALSL